MQFKSFGNRRVTIREAKKGDFDKYKSQLKVYHLLMDDKINIYNNVNHYYLAIEDIDKRLIGLIQIDEIDKGVICLKISIPNSSWNVRYGKEAIHQFIKCCKERKLYKRVYLKKNMISQAYKKERPEMFERGIYINIA